MRRYNSSESAWVYDVMDDLDGELDETMPIDDVELPAGGTLSKLHVEKVHAADGWLQVGARAY